MIVVTRLNGRTVVVNAELIKMIESTPDTLLTFTTGETMMVRETLQEVVEKAVDYQRRIHGFALYPAE